MNHRLSPPITISTASSEHSPSLFFWHEVVDEDERRLEFEAFYIIFQNPKEAGWADGCHIVACTQSRRLAVQTEKHNLLQMRHVAAYIYKKPGR
uniref:Uncharacterized protein n=1 Tax=Lactuca sativa TaxID=4236 RepID=A0A9R1UE09_LACSA|nr:hypothetical protein LSAT_V11C900467310 [Lactuca sativa]